MFVKYGYMQTVKMKQLYFYKTHMIMADFNIKTQNLIKEESSSANFSHNLSSPAMQGWQCPICKRVYSPFTHMCLYCGGKEVTTTTLPDTSTNFLK